METTNQKLQFKTNMHCGGCIAAVKPLLDRAEGIDRWEVDTEHPDKILTVESSSISEDAVIETVRRAGFTIETLH
jgi:copper chaperone